MQNAPVKIEDMVLTESRLLARPLSGDEVVVSGMAGRLPESDNVEQFFKNICDKKDMITDDDRRWKKTNPEIPHRTGKINHLGKMDAGAFGLHYKQVQKMEPMNRIVLERVYEAILDAGYGINEMRGSRTAVYIGVSISDSTRFIVFNNLNSCLGFLGCFRSLSAQWISSIFGFEGPSYVIDSACSSGMVIFEQAYRDISEGICDYALVGALSLCLSSFCTLQFARLGVLSPDGACKAFDERANGYVRSESVSILFLQKAKTARRVYGEVIHAKVNSDGYKEQGLTFLSGTSIATLIKDTYQECGVDPSTVDFLEAHATGTAVGDPEEASAIDEVYCKNRKKPLLVGSIKSYVGHTESASGLSSMIKLLLSMDSGCILPNIHFKTPRKTIKALMEGRIIVPTEVMPWPENGSGLVGINCSGMGGTNAHCVLKRFDKVKVNTHFDDLPRLVCISGRTEKAVLKILNDVSKRPLDVEYIKLLQQIFKDTGLEHLYRGYIVQSKQGTVSKSVSFFNGEKKRLVLSLGSGDGKLLVLGQKLVQLPAFADILQKIDSVSPVKISGVIADGSWSSPNDIVCTVAVQLALVDLFKTVDTHFDYVLGTSVGELAAAYANDKITLAEAMLKATKFLNQPPKSVTTLDDRFVQLTLLDIDSLETFIELLGRIYIMGHKLNYESLYPPVQWPVSAHTPMISPLIRWNYTDDWIVYYEYNFKSKHKHHINLATNETDWSFLSGHNIDGLVLIPATCYINIVLHYYCKSNSLNINESRVMFENIKFHRAIHISTPIQDLILQIEFFKNTNRFEINNDDQLVVSGCIYTLNEDLAFNDTVQGVHLITLQTKDIYKELQLRGYNYTGVFCDIDHVDFDGNVSWIKWENNWVSFMDKMLQTSLLQYDTRDLYVPISISQLCLDVCKHIDFVKSSENDLIPAYFSKEANTISCGGISIRGLYPTRLARRKIRVEPVIEKNVFVPFMAELSLENAVRVCVQILMENINLVKIKGAEFLNDEKPLTPLVESAVDDLLLLKCEMSALTQISTTLESGHSLIILTNASHHLQVNQAVSALKDTGFIISRQNSKEILPIKNLAPVAMLTTPDEFLILFKKLREESLGKIVKVTSDGSNFDWIPGLQEILKNDAKALLVFENESHSGALGFFNCLRREPGATRLQSVFIMDSDVRFDPNDAFFTDQLKKSLTFNVLKNGIWGTYRHLPLPELALVERKHATCWINQIGDLASLKWFETPSHAYDNTNGVQIEVFYSGMNFKDLALSSGLIHSDTFTKHRLEQINCYKQGMEFAGKDSRGRRVMGFTILSSSLSDRLAAEYNSLWEIPKAWSMPQAATIPVCYGTVILGFKNANIKKGDSILIHAGSGGIGQAALHIATWYNCNIFTTVSTEEKRQFVLQRFPHIPHNHIGNSRDTSFVEMVFKHTRGRGVDIVLNSLVEEKLQASVRCLAPRGRFIEIGRYDLFKNNNMPIALLTEGRTYASVMLDLLPNATVPYQNQLYNELDLLIKKNVVKPLHYTIFNHDEVEQAYRFMASGKHVGKLLIRVRDEHRPTLFKCLPRFTCSSCSTYIIVGGLGGVGLELADWLITRGARKLILVSRYGVLSGYAAFRINVWKSYEVEVQVSTNDVATRSGCNALLCDASQLGQVAAIFNLALVLKDNLFENQNADAFQTTLASKGTATLNLDLASRELCPNLEHFVVFSSVFCGRGNVGQTPYGLANSIMERICEKRKDDGYPALAIQWGAIGEVGILTNITTNLAEIGGCVPQRIESVLNVLDTFLTQNETIVSCMIVAEKNTESEGASGIVDIIKNILGITDIKTISEYTPLPNLGMDSISMLEIKLTLERECEMFLNTNEMRALTFAKLKEISDNSAQKSDTVKSKFDWFFKFIINEDEANTPVKKLTTLVEEGAIAPTFFIVPDIEGVTGDLEPLVCKLKAHASCLQYVYNTTEDDTITFLAQSLLSHIPSEEPFNIVAYSYGCVVAMELVSMLEARGQLGTVTLIDGSFEMFKEFAKQFPNVDSPTALETAIMINLMQLHMERDMVAKHQDAIFKFATLDERIEYVLKVVPSDTLHSMKYLKQVCLKSCSRIRSILTYEPSHSKIRSSVVLFKPSQASLKNFAEDYRLQSWCENPVKIEVIDGNHLTILNNPQLVNNINCIVKK